MINQKAVGFWFHIWLESQIGVIEIIYEHGMFRQVMLSKDCVICQVVLKYQNQNKDTDCFTTYAVIELVMIHLVVKLNLNKEQVKISSTDNIKQSS